MKQVVSPRWEARNDLTFYNELGERWEASGYARFTEEKAVGVAGTFYNIAAQRGASRGDAAAVCRIRGLTVLLEMPENPANAQFVRFAKFFAAI